MEVEKERRKESGGSTEEVKERLVKRKGGIRGEMEGKELRKGKRKRGIEKRERGVRNQIQMRRESIEKREGRVGIESKGEGKTRK